MKTKQNHEMCYRRQSKLTELPVQSNAIQYNSPAINPNFVMLMILHFC